MNCLSCIFLVKSLDPVNECITFPNITFVYVKNIINYKTIQITYKNIEYEINLLNFIPYENKYQEIIDELYILILNKRVALKNIIILEDKKLSADVFYNNLIISKSFCK